MTSEKQVNSSHYDFGPYMTRERWNSLYSQLSEILSLHPKNVLEIGPGPGVVRDIACKSGVDFKTIDIDPELKPDYVASATKLPLPATSYDIVCAFQMLEHLPYNDALAAIREMSRVSKRYIIISLPNALPTWRYSFFIPKVGQVSFAIPKPLMKRRKHIFNGEHYWEINKAGFDTRKVMSDIEACSGGKIVKSYRLWENTYHHFIIIDKGSYVQ